MKKILVTSIIFIGIWWLISTNLNEAFLPSPDKVFKEMYNQFKLGLLTPHLFISLFRVFSAIFCAFIPALILGIVSGRNKNIDKIISPIIYILFPIPKVALLPIILLFFGLGDLSKIFFVSLIIFFQFYLNIRDECVNLSQKYFDSLSTLGGKSMDIHIHIILPAILPRIFSSLRMTLGTAIAVLFLAETFATRKGIGWYIMDAWSRIAYVEMYSGITALSLTGMGLFILIDFLEKYFCPWPRLN